MVRGALALALVVVGASGCGLHPTNNDGGGAINLHREGDWLLVARGEAGLDVVDVRTGDRVHHVDPEGDADSVDDVTAEGGIVLALDADDGVLTSYGLGGDGALRRLADGIAVDVGPYSGVSVSGGVAVVSGGTCDLSVVEVGRGGALGLRGQVAGWRGKPDVTLLPGGGGAIVSTHFSGDEAEFVDGSEFGVSTLSMVSRAYVDARGLEGAGFTDGGGTPASWPVRARVIRDLAYVAHGGGLDVFRVRGDLALERLARTSLDAPAVDVDVDPEVGLAYVLVAEPARIVRVDVGDPARPETLDVLDVPGEEPRATAVVVAGDALYIADEVAGLVRLTR